MMKFHVVDLTKIQGTGEIKCPKCGTVISPDDETENAFTILETIMKENNLEKIILKCSKCQSQIRLTGFQLLKKI